MLVMTFVSSAFASAAQVTTRSIEMSSSATTASGVTYKVNFTPVSNAVAVVIDFCGNSPLVGETCAAPAGLDVKTSSPSTISGFTKDAASTANKLVLTSGTITATTNPAITVTGVVNPNTAGVFYARIITYGSNAGAQAYDSSTTGSNNPGTHVDDGAVALSATDKIAVSGAVLESLIFCASGGDITAGSCGGTLTPPTVKLGTTIGNETVLDALTTYQGTIYTQISTNASSGAIVSLKSNANGCGGLVRAGSANNTVGCGIGPAGTGGANLDGQAKFGVKLGTAVGVGTNTGTVRAFDAGSGAFYDSSNYKLKYNATDESDGVTSTYGDPILDTNGAPVNNMNMPLTFGASAANNTPAGRYSADLSLIATGKF